MRASVSPAPSGKTGDSSTDAGARDLASAARGGTLALVGAAISAVGGFALTVTVARTVGSTGAGVFFSTLAVFSIAAGICTFGADTGLVRQLSRLVALGRRNDLRRTVAVAVVPVVGLSFACTAGLLLARDEVLGLLLDAEPSSAAHASYVWFVALLTVGAAFTVVVQATRGLGSVSAFVGLQNVFLPLTRPLLVLALTAAAGTAAWLPAAAWTAPLVPALLLAAIVLSRLLRRAADHSTDAPPARSWRRLAGEFWSFSGWRGLASVLEIAMLWLDVLLVAALVGVPEAGIYAAASRFAATGTLVLQAMRLAIAPRLSALLATDQTERAGQLYRTATTWVIVGSWPIYVVMAVFSAPLLAIFGPEFRAASTALSVLAVAMMVNLATGNVTTVLLMAGRSSWMLFDKAVALLVMVSIDVLLVPDYGVTGAAIGWAASIVVDKALAVWQVGHLLGVHGASRASATAALAALGWFGGPAALCAVLDAGDTLGLAVTLVAGTCGYAATVWRLRAALQLAPLIALVGSRRTSARPTDTTPSGDQA